MKSGRCHRKSTCGKHDSIGLIRGRVLPVLTIRRVAFGKSTCKGRAADDERNAKEKMEKTKSKKKTTP
jgi:hypothetical protein